MIFSDVVGLSFGEPDAVVYIWVLSERVSFKMFQVSSLCLGSRNLEKVENNMTNKLSILQLCLQASCTSFQSPETNYKPDCTILNPLLF